MIYKYHYTYKLTFKEDPRFYYFGKRSTNYVDDSFYQGSGTTIRDYRARYGKDCFLKEILHYHSTCQEALEEEKRLVGNLWKEDPFCLNNCPGGAQEGSIDKTGTCRVWKDEEERSIPLSSLEWYLNEGWIRGRKRSCVEKNRKGHLGKKASQESVEKRSRTIKERWKDPEYRSKQMENRQERYRDHLQSLQKLCKGSYTIFKDDKEKRIRPEEFPSYEREGWRRGRCKKVS